MKFVIKASGSQITLPVTPESFQVEYARHTQTVNIHEVGDVNLPGNMALGVIKIDCMFPNRDYPFATDYGDPYEYVERFQKLIRKKKPVRFIVTETEVNERVLVESIAYGEKDGTGDVYAAITLAGYTGVSAAQTVTVASAPVVKRAVESPPVSEQVKSYKVESSTSTYFDIARAHYRDKWDEAPAKRQSIARALASYNGDKGYAPSASTLKIPPYEQLGVS